MTTQEAAAKTRLALLSKGGGLHAAVEAVTGLDKAMRDGVYRVLAVMLPKDFASFALRDPSGALAKFCALKGNPIDLCRRAEAGLHAADLTLREATMKRSV